MAPLYDWRNLETGEEVEHTHYSEPPALPGTWQRVFRFGLSRVEGGGSTPARSSVKHQ